MQLYYETSRARINRQETDEQVIIELVKSVCVLGGTMDLTRGVEIGPDRLSLKSNAGNHLLTLGVQTVDDYEVRALRTNGERDRKILICGYFWPAEQVTQCTDLILQAFAEFCRTGDVSMDILD